jgi:hypothetical protein
MTLIIQKPTGAKLVFAKDPVPFDNDAWTYIAAVEAADGQILEQATRNAITNFVLGCKADGIWSAIKASCILSGARTLTGALVPLVGTAPTNVGGLFVSGDYDRKTGLIGNGSTKYLDTNRAANADPQDNFSHGVYVSSAFYGAALQALIGHNGATTLGASHILIRSSANNDVLVRNRNNDSSGTSFSVTAVSPPTGFMGTTRNNASNYSTRISGSAAAINSASGAPLSANQLVFTRTANDTIFASARISYYWLGESLDLALLDARVTDLINAFGAAIP